MKSFIETSPGIITFRALPYPLPAHTQELLKDSSAVLAALNDAIEKAATKPAKKKAVDEYNAAFLDFEQQEELLRTYLGVEMTRPIIRSLQGA
jgi:hypothetical protein